MTAMPPPALTGVPLPPDMQAALAAGIAGYEAGQVVDLAAATPGAAIGIYRLWLASNANRADAWIAWFNLAILLEAAGESAGAMGAALTAFRQKPDLWQGALAAGQAAEAIGDWGRRWRCCARRFPRPKGASSCTSSWGGCWNWKTA